MRVSNDNATVMLYFLAFGETNALFTDDSFILPMPIPTKMTVTTPLTTDSNGVVVASFTITKDNYTMPTFVVDGESRTATRIYTGAYEKVAASANSIRIISTQVIDTNVASRNYTAGWVYSDKQAGHTINSGYDLAALYQNVRIWL